MDIRERLLFKGGTSLSKVYRLIERFSEDIDLSIDRMMFIENPELNPEKTPSKKERRRRIKKLSLAGTDFVQNNLLPKLTESFELILGSSGGNWSLRIDHDGRTILFTYPASLDSVGYEELSYLRPAVKLEFGVRSDFWPSNTGTIRPYAADYFPDFFNETDTNVNALSPGRTFWEKVTELHGQFHRPPEKPQPTNLSRHYYDVAMIADSNAGSKASQDVHLLARVVEHKKTYFPAPWKRYETAAPGTLQIAPRPHQIDALQQDYRSMQEMIFRTPPSFTSIVEKLSELEKSINSAR